MKNVLDKDVSYYRTLSTKEGSVVNLYEFLTKPIKSIDLEKLRLKHPDNKVFNEKVKTKLPAITPSGVFRPTRASANLVQHTGLMVVDIDQKDQNIDIDIIYNRLKGMEHMAYLGKSCSGKGLFGIMPIAYPDKHKSHFLSIEKELLEMDIVIDSSCKDIARMRLYSYDDEAYYNLYAAPYSNLYVAPPKQFSYVSTATIDINDVKLKAVMNDIAKNHINIAEIYPDWFKTATILNNEFGEDGRELFHIISSQSTKYDKDECDDLFDKVGNNRYEDLTIGTLYYLYNEAKRKNL